MFRLRRLAVVAGVVVMTTASIAQQPAPTFLILGQSNAEGYGDPAALSGTPHAGPQNGVWVWNQHDSDGLSPGWETLEAGVNTRTSSTSGMDLARFGPEITLGAGLRDALGGDVWLLKFAIDGTLLGSPPLPLGAGPWGDEWHPGAQEIYSHLLARISAAESALAAQNRQLDVRGIFWIQGSGDALFISTSLTYEANLADLVAALRCELGPSPVCIGPSQPAAIPFVISQVPTRVYGGFPHPGLPCGACYVDVVRGAESRAARDLEDVAIIDPVCASYVDGVHFDAPGQLAHGGMLLAAWLDLEAGQAAAGSSLTATTSMIDLSVGGAQGLEFDGGPDLAGASYVVLGALGALPTSAPPSLCAPFGFAFPLLIDAYLAWTLNPVPNLYHVGFTGTLDAQGRAVAMLLLPALSVVPLIPLGAIGLAPFDLVGRMLHVLVVVDPVMGTVLHVSNSVGVVLIAS